MGVHKSAKIMYRVVFLLAICLGSHMIDALANCPAGCLCNDEILEVICEEKANLDVFPIALNPSIKKLMIKNNKIRAIDSSVQFYPELESMDLGNNHLLNLRTKTFDFQRLLKELNLNNNKIGSIENSTFTGLQELRILNLRGNYIEELGDYLFHTLAKLEELNVGNNRISKLEPESFVGLISLKILYLDDNSLTSVPASSFLPLHSLAELFIGVNSFPTIQDNAFASLTKLTTLNLKGAALSNVSAHSFAGLESLRILDLSDNRLTRIPTKEMSTLSRLEVLHLGQNFFEVIGDKAFEGLSNLQYFEIVGSKKLQRIAPNAFIENGNLKQIKLQANKEFTSLEPNSLNGLPFLKVLILKDNAIETMRENLFEWSLLENLDLSDNPLRCDCHLLWYKSYLNIRSYNSLSSQHANNSINATTSSFSVNSVKLADASNSSSIVCSAPPFVKDKELRKVSAEFLGCTPTSDPRTQAIICGLLVVSAAIITALILVAYKCRRRKFRNVLKDSGWDISSTIGRKEREYQKTYAAPQYIDSLRKVGSSSPTHCNVQGVNNYQQYPLTPMIPITEL